MSIKVKGLKEMRKIVDVLNDEDKAYVDLRDNHKNIVFIYEDEKDKTKINKIVVDLNYKLKKFGLTNYMVTVGKVGKIENNKSEYIKIR